PRALEDLLQEIRSAANVRTRSTIILQTFYEDRRFVP
ncbi:MAG TPA: Lrp/AsnC family transcriptional regulator, partial [Mycobacterium sp.]|nr:Lrp/AsnC family transcriptional regulator [Mycobacterium sp.]